MDNLLSAITEWVAEFFGNWIKQTPIKKFSDVVATLFIIFIITAAIINNLRN